MSFRTQGSQRKSKASKTGAAIHKTEDGEQKQRFLMECDSKTIKDLRFSSQKPVEATGSAGYGISGFFFV